MHDTLHRYICDVSTMYRFRNVNQGNSRSRFSLGVVQFAPDTSRLLPLVNSHRNAVANSAGQIQLRLDRLESRGESSRFGLELDT